MSTKLISCREHGGTFEIEAKRGRPPVRCSDENPCSMAPRAASRKRVKEAMDSPVIREKIKSLTLAEWRKAAKDAGFSAGVINKMRTPAMFRDLLGGDPSLKPATVSEARANFHPVDPAPTRKRTAARKAVQEASEVTSRVNPSVPKAFAARALLEPQGWKVTGRSTAEGDDLSAFIVAARGEEVISMRWTNGELVDQSYSLWNTDKPSKNNAPAHKLPFDPDEMTDGELVRAMSGMKVTWWNRLASSTETAIVSADKVSIAHAFDGKGDETPADRVVTFVDMNGGGFRTFRVGALLKIG